MRCRCSASSSTEALGVNVCRARAQPRARAQLLPTSLARRSADAEARHLSLAVLGARHMTVIGETAATHTPPWSKPGQPDGPVACVLPPTGGMFCAVRAPLSARASPGGHAERVDWQRVMSFPPTSVVSKSIHGPRFSSLLQ